MTYQEFSSVLKRKPDADQEKVIRSLKNTIVSAGAGSGKTQTLASRFAYLITADLADENGRPIKNPSVDRILTLTFTKKAAAEMYQRIYLTLKAYSEKSPDPKGKERAKAALDNFAKAKIQTLDSYSSKILRQAAPLYGIRPDFAPGADFSQTKDLAFDFVMENRNNPALQWISDPAKLEECAVLLANAANENASIADSINKEKKCSVFAQGLEKQKKTTEKIWLEEKPLKKIEETIQKIAACIPKEKPKKYPAWHEKLTTALSLWNSQEEKEAREIAKTFSIQEGLFSDSKALCDFAQSKEITAILNSLKAFDFSNKIADEDTSQLVKNVLFGEDKKTAGLADEFNGLISFFSDYKYLKDLHPLLDQLTDKINDFKRKSGQLTFKDIGETALLALKEQESLRKQERDSYDFIMIDEFQDNNAANRDLLLLISKGDDGNTMKNRLFFVGDEKQSIYKFRGADVSVFNGLQKYLPECALLPMRRNYRSSNILLDAFNQIFGGFLPDDKDEPSIKYEDLKIFKEKSDFEFEASFDKNARAIFPETKEKQANTGKSVQVCLCDKKNLDADQNLDEKDAKALFIAKKILKLHNDEKVPYEKIALLVKSRTNYASISRIFTLNKIPFSLDQQKNIFSQALANDFYNALRLCVYPSDKNAFAAFLTSPFTGMTLAGAEKILSLFPQKAFDQEIQAQKILNAKELEAYQAAENFYKEFSAFALSNPISASIERLWQKEGYKFSPSANEEHYDLLYELARKADADSKDLSWFVDQLAIERKGFSSDESEIDINETDYPVENTGAVNVMTIHKSKGLQFERVFVWGLAENHSGGGGDPSKIFQSKEFGPVVAKESKNKNLFALKAKSENDKMESAEFLRLIYVALTRAIQSLYIIGSLPSSMPKDKPLLTLILNYALEQEKRKKGEEGILPPPPFETEEIPPYLRGSEKPLQSEGEKSLEEKSELYEKALLIQKEEAANFWTSPSQLEESASQETIEQKAASLSYPEINSFVNSSALAKNDYGTLFHAFMENWSQNPSNWIEDKIDAEEYFERNPLVQKI
nr:UvrD-helicase domain-containing protein [Treponema sp.]